MTHKKYPTDLDLNSEKDVHLDDANDLALVSGVAQLRQSIAIDVMDELQDLVGSPVTPEEIGLLEESIREGLNEDPQLKEVVNVTVTEYDRGNNSITIEARTIDSDTFTIDEVSP